MKPEEVEQLADKLVSRLERWYREQDRGPLAKLRRGLSHATRHEAWMTLGQHFGPIACGNTVFVTVAACFALHPFSEGPAIGNLGETMRRVMGDKMSDDKEPHARFRRFLACSTQEEICRHVPHAVRLAKGSERSVPVNYRALFVDLWWWNDRTKLEWAKAYWAVPPEDEAFSLAGVGAPVGDDEEKIG